MKESLFYIEFDEYYRTDEPLHDKKRNIRIGSDCVIRPHSFIYNNNVIKEKVLFGHNIILREKCSIGERSKIGSNAVIEGNCSIGNGVCIQSNLFMPTNTYVGNDVFIGPNVSMANDKYPPTCDYTKLHGAFIKDAVVICANVIILPHVTIGKDAFVAAGALVTKDVPDGMMAIGCPAKITQKPKNYIL